MQLLSRKWFWMVFVIIKQIHINTTFEYANTKKKTGFLGMLAKTTYCHLLLLFGSETSPTTSRNLLIKGPDYAWLHISKFQNLGNQNFFFLVGEVLWVGGRVPSSVNRFHVSTFLAVFCFRQKRPNSSWIKKKRKQNCRRLVGGLPRVFQDDCEQVHSNHTLYIHI